MVIRMTLPSLDGLAPTSESLSARSISGDQDGAGIRDGERGELLQRRGGTVVVHQDLVVEARVCPAGTDGSEVFLGYLYGLVHLFFGFEQGFFYHGLS
jgi:hypothetical protein